MRGAKQIQFCGAVARALLIGVNDFSPIPYNYALQLQLRPTTKKSGVKNDIIFDIAMAEKKLETGKVRYSSACPMDTKQGKRSTKAYRHIHFAVMAIENAAKRMKIPAREMYRRLKAQNLVHNRLLSHYDALHTQGIDWVAEDTVETLLNWEAAK